MQYHVRLNSIHRSEDMTPVKLNKALWGFEPYKKRIRYDISNRWNDSMIKSVVSVSCNAGKEIEIVFEIYTFPIIVVFESTYPFSRPHIMIETSCIENVREVMLIVQRLPLYVSSLVAEFLVVPKRRTLENWLVKMGETRERSLIIGVARMIELGQCCPAKTWAPGSDLSNYWCLILECAYYANLWKRRKTSTTHYASLI